MWLLSTSLQCSCMWLLSIFAQNFMSAAPASILCPSAGVPGLACRPFKVHLVGFEGQLLSITSTFQIAWRGDPSALNFVRGKLSGVCVCFLQRNRDSFGGGTGKSRFPKQDGVRSCAHRYFSLPEERVEMQTSLEAVVSSWRNSGHTRRTSAALQCRRSASARQ